MEQQQRQHPDATMSALFEVYHYTRLPLPAVESKVLVTPVTAIRLPTRNVFVFSFHYLSPFGQAGSRWPTTDFLHQTSSRAEEGGKSQNPTVHHLQYRLGNRRSTGA